jgi:dodecin
VAGDGQVPEVVAGRRSVAPQEDEVSNMPESVYKIIELVGTSEESWEKAATAAVSRASHSLRDLRIAEVAQLDLQIDNGQVKGFRARVKLSNTKANPDQGVESAPCPRSMGRAFAPVIRPCIRLTRSSR